MSPLPNLRPAVKAVSLAAPHAESLGLGFRVLGLGFRVHNLQTYGGFRYEGYLLWGPFHKRVLRFWGSKLRLPVFS